MAEWGGASFTARAVARVARLLLREGDWDGRRLLGAEWVSSLMSGTNPGAAAPAGFPDSSHPYPGLCGFMNQYGYFPELPDCAYFGLGANHQIMMVVPSLDLIVIRMGGALNEPNEPNGGRLLWQALAEHVAVPIVQSIIPYGKAPYPLSSAVRSVSFAPEADISIDGLDSDNWPTTWTEDGEQITSFGDGYGFLPHTEHKLSLGFARLTGAADNYQGVNIRTDTGERVIMRLVRNLFHNKGEICYENGQSMGRERRHNTTAVSAEY